MKHLLTSLLTVVCFATYAQFPSIPYNPDENGDGLIGVVDLQGLLANYGNEFASAVLSEDGESAIVFMGDMGYFECEYSCNQLPGFWTLPGAEDLVPVHPELHACPSNGCYTYTWIDKRDFDGFTWNRFPYYVGHSQLGSRTVSQTENQAYTKKCYCAAKQLPRVEYEFHAATGYDAFVEGCQALTEAGWFPIHGSPSSGYGNYSQAFWRWAE